MTARKRRALKPPAKAGVLHSSAVDHPEHYTQGAIECIDAIRESLGPQGFVAFCRGTAIKYAWRSGLKNNAAEDLRKGAWYLIRGAEVLEGGTDATS